MRLVIAAAAVSLLAASAFAQQSPSTSGAPAPPPDTMATPGASSATGGGNMVGNGTGAKTKLHSHHKMIAFHDRFTAANATGDGKLTLEQAKSAKMPMTVKNFSKIDKDGKGYVTEQDIIDYYKSTQNKYHTPPS